MAEIIPVRKLGKEIRINEIIEQINSQITDAIKARKPVVHYIFHSENHLMPEIEQKLKVAGYYVKEIKWFDESGLEIAGWGGYI
jgi:hypothetical protein